jgi:hypothetical protein
MNGEIETLLHDLLQNANVTSDRRATIIRTATTFFDNGELIEG